jgi:pyruvate kinase
MLFRSIRNSSMTKPREIKIITTVGPSSLNKTVIQRMDHAGVDIFRINLSHTRIEDLKNIIALLKSWTDKEICIDTEGAQLRTGSFVDNSVEIRSHEFVNILPAGTMGDAEKIPLSVPDPWNMLLLGDVLKIDFHSAVIQIIKIENKTITGRVLEGGIIGSNKGMCVDRVIKLPGFTEKDIMAFEIAKKLNIRSVALSFTSSAEDVIKLRDIFNNQVGIISKIESAIGLSNLEDICRESDAILIDRGDLSRDVPIEKIAFAQQYIQKKANELETPVYVATNLLENMITNNKPTRAEINDITYTLFAGAAGLVLAAETAIGNYPVESVRMISRIVNEVRSNNHAGDINYLCSLTTDRIIEPHGGELVQNYLWHYDQKMLDEMPFLEVNDELLGDMMQIADGTYSPLNGFMNYDELNSVLDEYKLPTGVHWTLPIVLQTTRDVAKGLPDKGMVAVKRKSDGICYAVIELSEKKLIPSQEQIAKKWFGTSDRNHPGVHQFMERGEWVLAGDVFLISKPMTMEFHYSLTPKQTRDIFNDRGWQKIVGFHTRNVIHRGHEYIQQKSLQRTNADAIYISPVVGKKKAGDFTADAILTVYQAMIKNGYYHPYEALLGTFNTYSRYSGPREAVFTAICRKNSGCSHFIIGRDHTGVGNYYPSDASQKMFDLIDIGMEILTFDPVYFCTVCNQVTEGCFHNGHDKRELSGSSIRTALRSGKPIPEFLMRKDIALELWDFYQKKPDAVFETA